MGKVYRIEALLIIWLVGLALPAQSDLSGDPQLEINRDVLLSKASSEKIRANAAFILITSPDPNARRVILESLSQQDQPEAHTAICKAISRARSERRSISDPDDLIGPLFRLLAGPDQMVARLAADALLAFGYDRVGPLLERMVADPNTPLGGRINGIYALRLQPDKGAAIALLRLVDDPNQQVVSEARDALKGMGIPEGRDIEERRQIIKELEAKSMAEFMRDWYLNQLEKLLREKQQLQQQQARIAALWKILTQTMDRYFALLSDDQERAKYLAENLKASEADRRLWAVEKFYQWRTSGKAIPPELAVSVGAVLSDEDGRVRYEAAKLLSITGQLVSPDLLLVRLEAEQDERTKGMVLLALGQACDYQLGSAGAAQVPVELRAKVLQWADRFLSSQDPNRVRIGAQVMQRLLDKPAVLAAEEVDRCLARLQGRFSQIGNPDIGLRSDLLRVMVILCGQQSGCRDLATKRFGPIFEKVYTDQDDKVRELAVDGLVSIDKGLALQRLRQVAINEKNPNIRARLMDLVGQAGRAEDLEWLAARFVAGNPDLDPAWQAFCQIITRADTAVAADWFKRFKDQQFGSRFQSQWGTFLELLARKASGQTELLKQVLQEQVLYAKAQGDLGMEAQVLARLLDLVGGSQRAELAGQLLWLYLQMGRTEDAAGILAGALEQSDLDEQNPLVGVLFRAKASGKVEANILDTVLRMVAVKEPRPNWEKIRAGLVGAVPSGQG